MTEYAYKLYTLALDTTTSNYVLETAGGYIFAKDASDSDTYVNMRIDDPIGGDIKLTRKTEIVVDFRRLYLSWPAQAGKSITLLLSSGYEKFRIDEGAVGDVTVINPDLTVKPATGALWSVTSALDLVNIVQNYVLPLSATEYSVNVSFNHSFSIRARNAAIQMAFVVGQSGTTYITIPTGGSYTFDLSAPLGKTITLYLQSATAGAVAEIIAI